MAETQESFSLSNLQGTVVSLAGPIYVKAHQGLGMVKPVRSTQKGPYQHGRTLTNATLNERVVTLKLAVEETTEIALWTQARALVALLNQLTTPLYLDVTGPDGTIKRLDVYYQDGLTLPREADDLYGDWPDVIQLVADNPIAYGIESVVASWAIVGGGTGWTIPWVFPWTIGESDIDSTLAITYPGSWPAFPIIRLTGPMEDPVVTNVTTGEVLSFNGTHFAAAEWVEIDCRYGYKTVTDDDGDNRLGTLTAASDLATFHLAPADEAVGGINDINVACAGAAAGTQAVLTYYPRYLSAV